LISERFLTNCLISAVGQPYEDRPMVMVQCRPIVIVNEKNDETFYGSIAVMLRF